MTSNSAITFFQPTAKDRRATMKDLVALQDNSNSGLMGQAKAKAIKIAIRGRLLAGLNTSAPKIKLEHFAM